MKNPQLHEHQGGFSDCRIWPIYIAYSIIGLSFISAYGSVGAFAMVVLTYGIFAPAYYFIISDHLSRLALARAEARQQRVKRSYSLPALPSLSVRSVLAGLRLRKKAA